MRALLLCLCLLAGNAWGATYYASPTGGAAASCVDKAANVCTLDRAITVSSTGDTIELAPGTYDYTSAGLNISSKNITLDSEIEHAAVITSTNASRTLALTPSNNLTPLIVGDVWVQGASASNPLQFNSVAYDADVRAVGTKVTVGTGAAIADVTTRGTSIIQDCEIVGTISTAAAISSSGTLTAAKKTQIQGCNLNLESTATALQGGILVSRQAGTTLDFYAEVLSNNVKIVQVGAGASAGLFGVRVNRVAPAPNFQGVTSGALVSGNTIEVRGIADNINTDFYAVLVSSTDATAVANGALVKNNVATCHARVARCISIGADGVATDYANNASVTDNIIYGTWYDGVSTPHGISLGRVNGGVVARNYVQGFAAAMLVSINNGGRVESNIVRGPSYVGLFAKGNTAATIANNTVLLDDSLGPRHGNYGCMSAAAQDATNNAATTFANNVCRVVSGATWKYVVVDSLQVATFQKNNYVSGVSLANPWSYQGAASANLAAWQSAQESSAMSVSPDWLGGTNPTTAEGFKLRSTSALIRAGTCVLSTGCIPPDYGNRRARVPPDIGAWQRRAGD
jgi:hypothetical protein